MALNLPANFKKDIQGRDTNLFPLVYFEILNNYVYISTNPFEFAGDFYKPLLLNIPSLKESIDISTRRYKINSINIDVSNFPYEGQRFSELVGDSSLINVKVNIYWYSPSSTSINTGGDGDVFQIYRGTVRRYEHDDEKVRLVVEDRSQATLHKDLPLPTHDLTGNDVPDKYKNKSIPMVYGNVDKSPCTISSSPEIDQWGITSGNVIMQVDTDEESNINNLYIFDNDYISIPKELALEGDIGKIFNYENGMEQFVFDNNFIRFSSSSTHEGGLDSNPISLNKIIAYQVINKDSMIFSPLQQKSEFWSSLVGWNPHAGGSRSWYGSYLKIDETTNNPSFYGSLFKEGDAATSNDWNGSYYLWDDSNYPKEPFLEAYFYDKIWHEEGGQDDKHEMKMVGGIVKTGVFDISSAEESSGILHWKIELWVGNASASDTGWGDGTGTERLLVRVGGDSQGDYDPLEYGIDISTLGGNFFTQINNGNDIPSDDGGWASIDVVDQLLIYCKATESSRMAVELKLKELTLYNYVLMKDMLSQDFYANVNGRLSYLTSLSPTGVISPTVPRTILDILNTELGQSIEYESEIEGDYLDTDVNLWWQYAFTVDKKINSKKLIEGIASASPYIPRFDNMGNFKFDIIRLKYSSLDHMIKEADVIDFSFSRTKIEDIATKIEFKYKWDYARSEFNKARTLTIDDFACFSENAEMETFGYYGLPDTHIESTLVIDDDRGKYIRDDETAERFVCWMMSWYANQHITIKVKLPLSYMLVDIGEIVKFDELLGDIAPYGIDYTGSTTLNFQKFYPYFMVTETNKRLDYVEISCIQMHELWAEKADSVVGGNMEYLTNVNIGCSAVVEDTADTTDTDTETETETETDVDTDTETETETETCGGAALGNTNAGGVINCVDYANALELVGVPCNDWVADPSAFPQGCCTVASLTDPIEELTPADLHSLLDLLLDAGYDCNDLGDP